MTLERFVEWVERNYPTDRYNSVYDLINDVEQRVNSDGNEFNEKVRQLLLEQFLPQFDPAFRAAQERHQTAQEVADMLGSGQIMQSLSDEIVDELHNPRSEIMDIDMTEYATTKETVIAPEIVKFARPSFFTRITQRFMNFLRR